MMSSSCPGGTIYTIRYDDAYHTLAPRFNTTVKALLAANPGIDPHNLQLGQQICIPVPPTSGSCPGGFLHLLQPGDTYDSLARRYNLAVPALIAANPGVDLHALHSGQQVYIPAPAPFNCSGTTYAIKAGDTFDSIARRHGTSIPQLLAINPTVDPHRLQPGQLICLPATHCDIGPIPCPRGTIYEVHPGDTIYSIARRNCLTLAQLLAANQHIADPASISPGLSLCIPPP